MAEFTPCPKCGELTKEEEGPCDFSFPCSEYHEKCQKTTDALKARVAELTKEEKDKIWDEMKIDGRDFTIARLIKENDRLHNHLHLAEQGVVVSIRRFLNEKYGPEKGDL